jgi:hypothetical protein
MGKKSKTTQSSTSTSSLDPYTQNLQRDNFAQAQAKFAGATYSPLTGDQIDKYQNPYTTEVIDAALGDNDRSRVMARNANNDDAIRAGAFGGTGRNVEQALTEGEYDRNAQSFIANLRNQGFNTAAGLASNENTAANNYPLLLQQLLNGTLGGVQGNITQTGNGTSTTKSFDPMAAIGQGAQVAAMFSDLRLKTDVETTHHDAKGRRWVNFKYIGDPAVYHGVIAQEVRETDPHAVFEHESGYLMVDYGALH